MMADDLDEEKNDLMREYEALMASTGGWALVREPGRLGLWASWGYVTWLEGQVQAARAADRLIPGA